MHFLVWMIRWMASLLCGALCAVQGAACRRALPERMIGSRSKHPGVALLGKGEMMVRLVLERWGFGGGWIPVPAAVPPPLVRVRRSKAIPSGRKCMRPALHSRPFSDFLPDSAAGR
jgi:hypothetical protein